MKYLLIIILILSLTGCASLGIYVLDDSLTAGQHNDLGVSYEQQNKLDLAEKEYKHAIKKDTTWFMPYFNLGNVYFKSSETDKAIKCYHLALKINPENSDIMNNLAFALMESGNLADARLWIQKAMAISAKPEYMDTKEKINTKTADNR